MSEAVSEDQKVESAPQEDPKQATASTEWPSLSPSSPLLVFYQQLPDILGNAGHSRIWGIDLKVADPPHFTTLLVLQKFLRAEQGNVDKSVQRLKETLTWRREYGIDKAGFGDEAKKDVAFRGLGCVTSVGTETGRTQIVTWNIYGAVKDYEATFGDVEKFLRWRLSLMEDALSALQLSSATTPIPDYGEGDDPYQIDQVHDYLNVSFLRMDPRVKAASKATIDTMSKHYPETLRRKFFCNVPYVMGWMYAFMKLFVAKETMAKFIVLSNGKELAGYFDRREDVPPAYGGSGSVLQ